jgi:autophagy-related protein 13
MHIFKMATVKLSIQDKKDLDKFTKFLALKAAQIIVQSRLGEKVQTKCKPHSSGTDWVCRPISCVVSSSVSMFRYKTMGITLQYGACSYI